MSGVAENVPVQYSLMRQGQTINGTIPANEVRIFTDLPVDLRHIGSGIDNKAITIKASADIVVYGINKQTWSTDGFLAFPVDVVGQDYYTSHYHPGNLLVSQCSIIYLFYKRVANLSSELDIVKRTQQCLKN